MNMLSKVLLSTTDVIVAWTGITTRTFRFLMILVTLSQPKRLKLVTLNQFTTWVLIMFKVGMFEFRRRRVLVFSILLRSKCSVGNWPKLQPWPHRFLRQPLLQLSSQQSVKNRHMLLPAPLHSHLLILLRQPELWWTWLWYLEPQLSSRQNMKVAELILLLMEWRQMVPIVSVTHTLNVLIRLLLGGESILEKERLWLWMCIIGMIVVGGGSKTSLSLSWMRTCRLLQVDFILAQEIAMMQYH